MLEPFGDVVTRPHDDVLYLSWYSVCKTGWSQSLKPPDDWNAAAIAVLGIQEQERIIRGTPSAFNDIIGIPSVDGYFSMNNGRLTTAPFLALQLGELLS